MKILGLITEYNPFHNGHLYHLEKAKETTGATHSVAVMSGQFLQRGEPALLHKWIRAHMAVANGVDLVLELPFAYACNTAELFGFGGVSLLNRLGLVDTLCFGSETGRLEKLSNLARLLQEAPPLLEGHIQAGLKKGLSFPAARSQGLLAYLNTVDRLNEAEIREMARLLDQPNNILSLEYLKALMKLNSPIKPCTIKRKQAAYHATAIQGTIASATAIRTHLFQGNSLKELAPALPGVTYELMEKGFHTGVGPVSLSQFETTILALLRRTSSTALKHYFDVTEGLENRIKKGAELSTDLTALLSAIKTKRYPRTRLQRICIHLLLNMTAEDVRLFQEAGGPQYIRVLAFNNKGRELLKLAKKRASLPIITKIHQFHPPNEAARRMLQLDLLATDLYRLAIPDKQLARLPLEHLQSPLYLP